MEEEMLPEYDFKSMRPVKMGKGRKSWYGIPNPDYDWRFGAARHLQLLLRRALEVGENADTETGIDGKLAPAPDTAPIVTLDADVAKVFKNAAAVNTALRLVIQIADDGTDVAK